MSHPNRVFVPTPTHRRQPRFAPHALSAAIVAALALPAQAADASRENATTLQTVRIRSEVIQPTSVINMNTPAKTSKLNVSVHETPASIAVIDRQFIEDTGAKNIQDALLYSAGVYAGNYGFDTRGDWAAIRGLDASNYLDGLRSIYGYYNANRTEIYSLERIEVLKGPSSSLYGQSELGGIVNGVSKLPKAERKGEIWAQAGSFDRTQIAADVTGPIDAEGQWLYRAVALSRDSNTQVNHVDDDVLLLTPSITWRPSEGTELSLLFNHQKNESQVSAQFLPSKGTIDPAPRGRIDTDTFVGEPGWDRYDTERTDITLFLEQALGDKWKLAAVARQTESEAETREHWTNIPQVPDDDGNIGRTIYTVDRETDVKSFDIRVEGNFDLGPTQHTLAVGVDYQDALWKEDNYIYSALGGTINLYDPVYGNLQIAGLTPSDRPDNALEQTGIYLIDHIAIGRVLVSASVRRDDAESTVLNLGATPDYVREDKETSSHIGLMYKFDNGLAPYISYTEAFSQNLGTNAGFGLKPTTGTQDEVGVKYLSPAQDLSVAFAWFDIEQENRVEDGLTPGGVTQVGATVEGWELEVKKRWQRFELLANYTDLDAQDASIDERLPAVAEKVASVWGKYELGNGLRFGIGARYNSDNVGWGGSPVIDGVTLYDAMIGYAWGNWDFSLDGKNLSDEVYVSWCRYQGADCGYGERRTWNGNVRYAF